MTPCHIWNKIQNSVWSLWFLNHNSHHALPHFVPYILISLFSQNMTNTLPPQGHSFYQNVLSTDMRTTSSFTSLGSLLKEFHLRKTFPDHLNGNGSPIPTSTLHHLLPLYHLLSLDRTYHSLGPHYICIYLLIVCCPPKAILCFVHSCISCIWNNVWHSCKWIDD